MNDSWTLAEDTDELILRLKSLRFYLSKLLQLSAEIDQGSTLSELKQFFRDLGVSYERDRSKQRLIGIMRPSAGEGHGIDFPAKIELSYTRCPRRFDVALISNLND